MKLPHRVLIVLGSFLVASGLAAEPVPALADAPAIATQGHLIKTADGAQCSIGYVESTRAWTAAHCGYNGQAIYNEYGSHIGTLRYLNREGAAGRDIAYIQFAKGTVSGGNPLSGDGIVGVPVLGTPLCVTGMRTGQDCSQVEQRPYPLDGFYSTGEMHKRHGDSGSGAYIPGVSGTAGIYTGTVIFTFGDKKVAYEDFAAMPSAQEMAGLEQGFVARKPDFNNVVSVQEFPLAWWRQHTEPLEAMWSILLRGATFDDLRGVLAVRGMVI